MTPTLRYCIMEIYMYIWYKNDDIHVHESNVSLIIFFRMSVGNRCQTIDIARQIDFTNQHKAPK